MRRAYVGCLVAAALLSFISIFHNLCYSIQFASVCRMYGAHSELQWHATDASIRNATINQVGLHAVNTSGNSTSGPEDSRPREGLQVLLFSSQRSGSTMMGNMLFQNLHDKEAFYWYEPLDALYTSLYGTEPGWNVPADITFHANGTQRELPEREQHAVHGYLKHILQCKLSLLPVEAFVHPFWFNFPNATNSMKRYPQCLRRNGITQRNLGVCRMSLRRVCGRRIHDQNSKRALCNKKMTASASLQSSPSKPDHRNPWKSGRPRGMPMMGRRAMRYSFMSPLVGYKSCLKNLQERSSTCRSILQDACDKRPVTAMKTVRATMASVRTLLNDLPQLKVIHLLRDPRGVVTSRIRSPWSQGIYDFQNIARMAEVYCNNAMRDLRLRREIAEQYPGRLLEVVFDHFLLNPVKESAKISDFLGEKFLNPDAVFLWISEHINTTVKDKWKKKLTVADSTMITSKCQYFINALS